MRVTTRQSLEVLRCDTELVLLPTRGVAHPIDKDCELVTYSHVIRAKLLNTLPLRIFFFYMCHFMIGLTWLTIFNSYRRTSSCIKHHDLQKCSLCTLFLFYGLFNLKYPLIESTSYLSLSKNV